MSARRLQARVPSASFVSKADLFGYRLRFHKRSQDGSSKCNAFATGRKEDIVCGVLFQIDPGERPLLDAVEGVGNGYVVRDISVDTGILQRTAFTYIATDICSNIRPYSWYLSHVVIGAKEADLPGYYVAELEAVSCTSDPDSHRDKKERSIYHTN